MPLLPSSMTGNASWKGISEQTQVFKVCKQPPTEAPENFVCSWDQNIRPKVKSHIRKISVGPWNLGFVITGFRKRSVRILSNQKNAYHGHIQKLNRNIWKFPFVACWNEHIPSSQLESAGSLRSTDLHLINSGPFSNPFASKITKQPTSAWECPAARSPVQPGVLASWRQTVQETVEYLTVRGFGGYASEHSASTELPQLMLESWCNSARIMWKVGSLRDPHYYFF